MFTVTAAIIKRNGKYLIARRKAGDAMGGYWEFPGGKVDGGETPDQGMARELMEELGVKAKPLSLFDTAVTPDGRAVILFYECEIEGEPKALDSDELRWAAAGRLKDYEFLPADRHVVARLEASAKA